MAKKPAIPPVVVAVALPARQAKTILQFAEAMDISVQNAIAEAVRFYNEIVVPSKTYYSHGRRLRFLTDAEWEAARPEEWVAAKAKEAEWLARNPDPESESEAAHV